MPNDNTESGGVRNRVLQDLVDAFFSTGVHAASAMQPLADPASALVSELNSHRDTARLFTGLVTMSLPYANWYKVQLDKTGGVIACSMASDTGAISLGPRNSGQIPPYSRVIVWVPPGQRQGYILSAYACQSNNPKLLTPDWVLQGSGVGIKRETQHTAPLRLLYRQGGIRDFNGGRPLDATQLDWGRITELGGLLHIDPFLLQFRISEMCGVWFNYFDQHTRLAGMALDIQNPAFEINARDDEGELRYVETRPAYPWEGVGMYGPGTPVHKEYTPEEVQIKLHRGTFDLPDDADDTQAISRWQEYGGYLGQGHRRSLMIPAKDSGRRKFSDDAKAGPDMGVFAETIGLDGSYLLQSAKRIGIVKRVLIPVPKETAPPEQQLQDKADSAAQNNYRFSGQFNTDAKSHKIGDIDDSAVAKNDRHFANVMGLPDVTAFNANWQGLHPFHYHTKDFAVPEESDLSKLPRGGGLSRVQDHLDFSELATKPFMAYPDAHPVKVDHRYNNVDYFQRESGISFPPDGSVVLYDGYGAQITLSGGHITLDCPGDVKVAPGCNVVAFGGRDIILRANNSLDATAGNGNVTIKAEKTLMMLGGNEATGGVVIESKAPGFITDFDNKFGEDVVFGGIMLKAPKSAVVAWAGEIYLRTGTKDGSMNKGPIVLDAAAGAAEVVVEAATFTTFTPDGVLHFMGPKEDNDNVSRAFVFSNTACILDADEVLCGGAVIVRGAGLFDGAVISKEGMLTLEGPTEVIKISGGSAGQIRAAFSAAQTATAQLHGTGKSLHREVFTQGYYATGRPGNDATINAGGFSLRDDAANRQYRTDSFKLPESRWQQIARMAGDTYPSWSEPVVTSGGGRKQLPYPGRQKWDTEETMQQLAEFTMFDVAAGRSKDRGDVYETPKLGAIQTKKPSAGFKVII